MLPIAFIGGELFGVSQRIKRCVVGLEVKKVVIGLQGAVIAKRQDMVRLR